MTEQFEQTNHRQGILHPVLQLRTLKNTGDNWEFLEKILGREDPQPCTKIWGHLSNFQGTQGWQKVLL